MLVSTSEICTVVASVTLHVRVTFPPGATVERVLIPLVDDGVREPSETFTVHLAQPQGGVAGAVTTTRVTIYDDD